MVSSGGAVEIVEVGPRDGFQGIEQFIPTETKIGLLRRLVAAGLHRIEIGSFVSALALPQMKDTPDVLEACRTMSGLRPQVLVPNARRGSAAIEAGARAIVFVLSVSEAHNRSNVKRSPLESVTEYEALLGVLPADVEVRLDIATSFDCPFNGRVAEDEVLALLDRLVPLNPGAEICLCDTTGRATPDHVGRLFRQAAARFPQVGSWAMHAHDTYGLGLANVLAAYQQGVRVFDSSFAGLGGCPFAPGATGNVATEDVIWMFEAMGIPTGVDLSRLIPVCVDGAAIPGGQPGGRVRAALASRKDGGACR